MIGGRGVFFIYIQIMNMINTARHRYVNMHGGDTYPTSFIVFINIFYLLFNAPALLYYILSTILHAPYILLHLIISTCYRKEHHIAHVTAPFFSTILTNTHVINTEL